MALGGPLQLVAANPGTFATVLGTGVYANEGVEGGFENFSKQENKPNLSN